MHASIKRPLSPLTSHGALLIILGRTVGLEIMLSLSFLMGAKGQSFRNGNGGIRERWGKGEVTRKSSGETWGNPPLEHHIYTAWSIISLFCGARASQCMEIRLNSDLISGCYLFNSSKARERVCRNTEQPERSDAREWRSRNITESACTEISVTSHAQTKLKELFLNSLFGYIGTLNKEI